MTTKHCFHVIQKGLFELSEVLFETMTNDKYDGNFESRMLVIKYNLRNVTGISNTLQ